MITAYWEYFIQQVNSIEVNTVSSIFKLSLSLLLGCLVGFERKRKGQIEGFESEFFDGDKAMLEGMENALKLENIAYHKGIIASGDRFIADKTAADKINSDFGAISCEMESAAIAQVCALYNVPFLAMRAISDNGGDGAIESFYEFLHRAAENNAKAIKRFMQK